MTRSLDIPVAGIYHICLTFSEIEFLTARLFTDVTEPGAFTSMIITATRSNAFSQDYFIITTNMFKLKIAWQILKRKLFTKNYFTR